MRARRFLNAFPVCLMVGALTVLVMWEAAGGAPPAPPAAKPESKVRPDGVVSVVGDSVRQWDVVRAVAFSPDGKVLVSGQR